MPALVAGIHVFKTLQDQAAWMAGTSPAKTCGAVGINRRAGARAGV
ncbi:MAG: hypothetical protein MZV49_22940 [Rhodopseudomonas palustris]|nr:hypothetical protein [Rhodopseudomonas palustris]